MAGRQGRHQSWLRGRRGVGSRRFRRRSAIPRKAGHLYCALAPGDLKDVLTWTIADEFQVRTGTPTAIQSAR